MDVFLADVLPLIREASSVLTGGELQAFKLCVGVSLVKTEEAFWMRDETSSRN